MEETDFRQKIRSLVGDDMYRHALFYHYPDGLRFELSSGDSALDLVLTALNKATAICTNIFEGKESVLVHLQRYAPENRFQLRSTMRELREAGIIPPRNRSVWLEQVTADETDAFDDGYWVQCAFELPVSKVPALLWCALACDFPALRPNPRCLIYLLNLDKGIVAHPYDDRGMDVIGTERPPLEALYVKYKNWLLDYDLDAMKQNFEGTGGASTTQT